MSGTTSPASIAAVKRALIECLKNPDERDLALYALGVGAAQNPLGGELAYRYGVRVADEKTQVTGYASVSTNSVSTNKEEM